MRGEAEAPVSSYYESIPSHWTTRRLQWLCSERVEKNRGLAERNLLSLSYGRIVRKSIDSADGLLPASFETYNCVKRDDIVFRLTDLQNDQRSLRTGLVKEDGIITSAYVTVRPTRIESRFLAYVAHDLDLRKVFYSLGGGLRQSMGFDDLKHVEVVVPPALEQRAIADFLDRETAEIDAFIADQERLIELLTERRRSSIAAELKMVGTQTVALKYTGSIVLGKMLQTAPNEGDRVRNYMRAANVQPDGVLKLSDAKQMPFSPAEAARLDLRRGDVVIVEGGVGGYGRAAYLEQDLCGWGFQNSIIRIRPNEQYDGEFLALCLQELRASGYIEMTASVTSMPHYTAEKVANTRIPDYSLSRQRELVAKLRPEQTEIDAAIADAREAIALSKERRAALISAAVTGKIDVRN